ncbi:MAG: hypothetical protein NT178_07785 [Proteobacteria bacterium]|nr:hypothetical protein [Pseudomonadota bacterium]
MRKTLMILIDIFILAGFLCIPHAHAWGARNSLTFINHSGDFALVKLIGPTRDEVKISNGKERTIRINEGQYEIFVRYGNGPHYRYAKGESFVIEGSSNTYTEASLTLHGVVNGNYRTEDSSEDEFNGK